MGFSNQRFESAKYVLLWLRFKHVSKLSDFLASVAARDVVFLAESEPFQLTQVVWLHLLSAQRVTAD